MNTFNIESFREEASILYLCIPLHLINFLKFFACSKVYLPGQPLATCKELQEILGKHKVIDEKGHERTEYLMDAFQIRLCEEAIILVNSTLPLKKSLRPYYNHLIYNRRTKIPAFVQDRKIPFDSPPLLKFD